MTRIIDDAQVENAARALLGAIDTGDGGTPEQHAVLQAFVAGYWERPDLDLASLEPLDPAATAAGVPRAAQRHRVREFMVLLEMCRHPQTPEQVALVDRYAAAMGEDGEGLQLARTIVKEGTARAFADFSRFRDEATVHWAEPSLVDRYLRVLDAPDQELVDRLLAMHDLPENTLGWRLRRLLPPARPETPGRGHVHPGVLRGPRHEPRHRGIRHDRSGGDGALRDDPRDGRHAGPLGAAAHEHRGLRVGAPLDRRVRRQARGASRAMARPH